MGQKAWTSENLPLGLAAVKALVEDSHGELALQSQKNQGSRFSVRLPLAQGVGAIYEDGLGSNRGAACVLERNQGGPDNWGEMGKLTASDAEDDDWFGQSVGISGATIVIGSYGANGGGTDQGTAYIFSPQPYWTYLPLTRNN